MDAIKTSHLPCIYHQPYSPNANFTTDIAQPQVTIMFRHSLPILALVTLVVAQNPAPSGTACTYVCPPADNAGFALDPTQTTQTATVLHCEYPVVTTPSLPGEFYCDYALVSPQAAFPSLSDTNSTTAAWGH